MGNVAIRAEELSKQYVLGQRHVTYGTLRDHIANGIRSMFNPRVSEAQHQFWALHNVSFEVSRGESIGIIGNNGAGKSTLLKILSRITEPTSGSADLYGRTSSLLEVGTGFHPELTGRENIYLNAAFLGMRRHEIRKIFEQIVEFAGIGGFLDTPVKRYSSGMYVRLAFAVAAHLEPDILIVDEVLAVGDMEFQQRCVGKMEEVSKTGRTVLFVSHNMPVIERFCKRAILLRAGKLVREGDTKSVIKHYADACSQRATVALDKRSDRKGAGEIVASWIEILDERGIRIPNAICGHTTIIRLHYKSLTNKVFRACMASVSVHAADGTPFFLMSNELTDPCALELSGDGHLDFIIPQLPLSGGVYRLDSYLESKHEMQDWVESADELTVIDGDFYGTGKLHYPGWEGRTVLVKHHVRHGRYPDV